MTPTTTLSKAKRVHSIPNHRKGKGKTYQWLLDHLDYQGDNCLPWPFCKDGRVGRGLMGHDGKRWWAHRLMCVLAHGEPPTPKHQAAHNCGKGHYGCVNPRHLEWKTNSENQIDRAKNGNALRNPYGNKGGLTPAQQAGIISLRGKMTQVAIAAKFGVSLGCVQYWMKYRAMRGHGTISNEEPVTEIIDREYYKGSIEELRRALEEIDAVAVGKKAGAAKRMQEIARKALSNGHRGDKK